MNNYNSPCTREILLQSRTVDIFKPSTFTLTVEEVLHGLSNINRYNGNTIRPYSVAEHCINCGWALRKHLPKAKPHQLLYIVLHDAGEVVTQDLLRPIKLYTDQRIIDAEERILDRFIRSLPFSDVQLEEINSYVFQQLVKEIDTRMCATEIEQLFPRLPRQLREFDTYDVELTPMNREDYEGLINTLLQQLRKDNENS